MVGTVTAAVNEAFLHRAQMPWVQRGQLFTQAAQAFEAGGPRALEQWLAGLRRSHARFSRRTYVIGPDGLIRTELTGAITAEQLGAWLPQAPSPE